MGHSGVPSGQIPLSSDGDRKAVDAFSGDPSHVAHLTPHWVDADTQANLRALLEITHLLILDKTLNQSSESREVHDWLKRNTHTRITHTHTHMTHTAHHAHHMQSRHMHITQKPHTRPHTHEHLQHLFSQGSTLN